MGFDFTALFHVVPQVIMLIAGIRYVSRHQEPPAIMIALGSAVLVVTGIFYALGLPLLVADAGMNETVQHYLQLSAIAGFLGGLLLSLGVLLLVQKTIKRYEA